jgi:hypothetical protein
MTDPTSLWDRQPNEPARWFARFETYRLLGPSRTIEAAFQAEARTANLTAARPGQAWYNAAQRYDWQTRAEAWDNAQRARIAAIEEPRRVDARERRIAMIDHILTAVYDVLRLTDLHNPAPELARTLPTVRTLFKDLLAAQRAEIGMPAGVESADTQSVALTADALLAAQQELESFKLALSDAYPPKLADRCSYDDLPSG